MSPPTPGSESSWLTEGYLFTRFWGHMPGRVVAQTAVDVVKLLQGRTMPVWLVCTEEVSNIHLDLRQPALDLLGVIKKAGAKEIFAGVPVAPVRLFASTISFAAGIRLHAYATTAEAKSELKKKHSL